MLSLPPKPQPMVTGSYKHKQQYGLPKNEAAERTPTASLKSMVVVVMLLSTHRMKVKVIPYVSCQASAPFQ